MTACKNAVAGEAAEQNTVTFEDATFYKLTEGQATILLPTGNDVFYNPVQEFNRDLSIAVIKAWDHQRQEERKAKAAAKNKPVEVGATFTKPIRILEALAASGLRSIRYAKEIPNLSSIVANDMSEDAVKSINRNIKYNEIPAGLVVANQSDAWLVVFWPGDSGDVYNDGTNLDFLF